MRFKKVWFVFLVVGLSSLCLTAGCQENTRSPSARQSPFDIVVVSDIHTRIPGYPDEGYYDSQANLANAMFVVDRINETYPDADFVAVNGDLVGCLFSETPEDYLTGEDNPAGQFKRLFDHLMLPYYPTLGNHDYHTGFDPVILEHIPATDFDAVESAWINVLGIDPYYSFIHKGVHMIFLNSNRGTTRHLPCSGLEMETLCMGSFDPAQMVWLNACLNRPEPAVIFTHHPPAELPLSPERPFWISILSEIMVIDPADPFYDIIQRHRDRILAIFFRSLAPVAGIFPVRFDPCVPAGPVGDTAGSGETWPSPESIRFLKRFMSPGMGTMNLNDFP